MRTGAMPLMAEVREKLCEALNIRAFRLKLVLSNFQFSVPRRRRRAMMVMRDRDLGDEAEA